MHLTFGQITFSCQGFQYFKCIMVTFSSLKAHQYKTEVRRLTFTFDDIEVSVIPIRVFICGLAIVQLLTDRIFDYPCLLLSTFYSYQPRGSLWSEPLTTLMTTLCFHFLQLPLFGRISVVMCIALENGRARKRSPRKSRKPLTCRTLKVS